MMPAPLGHATGFLHGVTAPFLLGAQSVLLDIFTPEVCLSLLEQQRCTCMLGATPFVYDLLNFRFRVSSTFLLITYLVARSCWKTCCS